MTVIVMTREMGTLGKEVAREFAARKGYSVVHHELVQSPEEREAMEDESEVYRFLESTQAEIDEWRNNHTSDGYLTRTEVLSLASEGEVLIRGWGATRLLKSVPNILSVRVCAPMAFRVSVMMERLGVDEDTAQREIRRSDAAHSRTFLRFFQNDWRAAENYDLVLNTSHVAPADCAQILLDAAEATSFGETEEMHEAMNDMLLSARIDEELRTQGLAGLRGRHVEAVVDRGAVRLFGVVSDAEARRSAENIIASKFAVAKVQNDIFQAKDFVE